MRTHPTFYVGHLRPYYQYELVSRCEEHLRGREPRPFSSGPGSTSQSGRLAKRPVHAAQQCLDGLQPAHNEETIRTFVLKLRKRKSGTIVRTIRALRNCNYPLGDHGAHDAESVHDPGHPATVPLHGSASEHQADPTLELDQVFPPPPHPLVDSGGGQRFLVERILNHCDLNGIRTTYLVRWRGYPPAWDSWEPRSQLIVDATHLVEQYDETYQLRSRKGRRKMTSPNASTGTAKCPSLQPPQKRCSPSCRNH
uniref:Chromo domain-containing protein n=1 Tax=Peronospora matthiolae TaxID=2874970 RepID=A0AAV1UQU3_9STRA